MDAQSLAAEVQTLSAHYSVDTSINLRPRKLGPATASGNENETIPTLSSDVLAFLAARHVDAVMLANKPVVNVSTVRDDLPLKHYFVSSSHNTYLLGWQLLGRSSAAAYTHVLLSPSPARCIEIDVWWDGWPGRGVPVVTHGWTLSSSVPFVDVCMAIAQAVRSIRNDEDGNDWPVFISLECHVPPVHQDELVRIMVECWGEMLVKGEVEGLSGETVTPRQLRGRIVLMVEYYPDAMVRESGEDVVSETEEIPGDEILPENVEANGPPDPSCVSPKIADSLAYLGFYARSMKPPKAWWLQAFPTPPYPPNITLNVNEFFTLPQTPLVLQQHATHYLRRVYPNGGRVNSSNLNPWMQWQIGTQMACLNWQNWDEGMWLNDGMFAGTGGWVVRPDPDLGCEEGRRERKLIGRVVGLSALPRPEGDQGAFVGYCRAELYHRDGKRIWQSEPAHQQRDADSAPAATAKDKDLVHLTWDQTFEWTFCVDTLTFLLLRVVHQHPVRRDEDVAMFCARLDQLASGLCLIRLLDMRGKYVGATLLCEFTL